MYVLLVSTAAPATPLIPAFCYRIPFPVRHAPLVLYAAAFFVIRFGHAVGIERLDCYALGVRLI